MSLDNIYNSIAGTESKTTLPEFHFVYRKDLRLVPIDLQIKILKEFANLIAFETNLKEFEFDRNTNQKELEKLTDYIQGDSILVYATDTANGDLIGTAILRAMVIGNVRTGVLGFLTIAEAYRHQGLGTLLMAKIEKVAKGLGCKSMYLTVLSNNKAAVEFYKENDYKSIAMQMAKNI